MILVLKMREIFCNLGDFEVYSRWNVRFQGEKRLMKLAENKEKEFERVHFFFSSLVKEVAILLRWNVELFLNVGSNKK